MKKTMGNAAGRRRFLPEHLKGGGYAVCLFWQPYFAPARRILRLRRIHGRRTEDFRAMTWLRSPSAMTRPTCMSA